MLLGLVGVLFGIFCLLFEGVILLLFFFKFFHHSYLSLLLHESSLFGSFGLFLFLGFGDGLVFEFLLFLIEFFFDFLES